MREIYYLTGAFGCGKTTTVRKLKSENNITLLEDESLLFLLKNPIFHMRNMSFMITTYYNLHKAIQRLNNKESKVFKRIVVDGHPLHSWMYTKAVFELNKLLSVSEEDLQEVTKVRDNLLENTREMFQDVSQTIIFIDLPIEEHWKRVEQRHINRISDFPEELDIDYLKAVRKIFKQNILPLARDIYKCNLITVNSTEEILKMDL